MGISFKWAWTDPAKEEKERREKEIIDHLQGWEISPCHPGGQILVCLNHDPGNPLGKINGIISCECRKELMDCRTDNFAHKLIFTILEEE